MVNVTISDTDGIDSWIIEALYEAGADEELSSGLLVGALTRGAAEWIGRHRVPVVYSLRSTDSIGSFPMRYREFENWKPDSICLTHVRTVNGSIENLS